MCPPPRPAPLRARAFKGEGCGCGGDGDGRVSSRCRLGLQKGTPHPNGRLQAPRGSEAGNGVQTPAHPLPPPPKSVTRCSLRRSGPQGAPFADVRVLSPSRSAPCRRFVVRGAWHFCQGAPGTNLRKSSDPTSVPVLISPLHRLPPPPFVHPLGRRPPPPSGSHDTTADKALIGPLRCTVHGKSAGACRCLPTASGYTLTCIAAHGVRHTMQTSRNLKALQVFSWALGAAKWHALARGVSLHRGRA